MGFKRFGASQARAFSIPPPPRFVGAELARGGAWARPEPARSWLAIGTVSPNATIVWTNSRRDSRRVFTSPRRLRTSRSFTGVLLPAAGDRTMAVRLRAGRPVERAHPPRQRAPRTARRWEDRRGTRQAARTSPGSPPR